MANSNQYYVEYRKSRKKLGICIICGNSAVKDMTLCMKCAKVTRIKSNEAQQKLKELGFCYRCHKQKAEENNFCKECHITRIKNQQAKRNSRRQQVKCIDCGDCIDQAKRCKICHVKLVARNLLKDTSKYKLLLEIYDKQGGRCPYSGRMLIIGQNAELDHIIPKSAGGTGEITNLQWVYSIVNRMKWKYSQEEFLTLIEEIYNHRIRNDH